MVYNTDQIYNLSHKEYVDIMMTIIMLDHLKP